MSAVREARSLMKFLSVGVALVIIAELGILKVDDLNLATRQTSLTSQLPLEYWSKGNASGSFSSLTSRSLEKRSPERAPSSLSLSASSRSNATVLSMAKRFLAADQKVVSGKSKEFTLRNASSRSSSNNVIFYSRNGELTPLELFQLSQEGKRSKKIVNYTKQSHVGLNKTAGNSGNTVLRAGSVFSPGHKNGSAGAKVKGVVTKLTAQNPHGHDTIHGDSRGKNRTFGAKNSTQNLENNRTMTLAGNAKKRPSSVHKVADNFGHLNKTQQQFPIPASQRQKQELLGQGRQNLTQGRQQQQQLHQNKQLQFQQQGQQQKQRAKPDQLIKLETPHIKQQQKQFPEQQQKPQHVRNLQPQEKQQVALKQQQQQQQQLHQQQQQHGEQKHIKRDGMAKARPRTNNQNQQRQHQQQQQHQQQYHQQQHGEPPVAKARSGKRPRAPPSLLTPDCIPGSPLSGHVTARQRFNTWQAGRELDTAEMTIGSDLVLDPGQFFIYRCDAGVMAGCCGWADRVRGILGAYIIANLTGRVFKVEMLDQGCDLTDFYVPNKVNWTLPHSFHPILTNRTPDTQILDVVNDHSFTRSLDATDFSSVIDSKVKYVYFKGNLNYLVHLRNSTVYRQRLAWMRRLGWHRIHAILFRRLFVTSAGFRSRLGAFLSGAGGTGASRKQLVCAHVRVGDSIAFFKNFHNRQEFPLLDDVWQFITKKAVEFNTQLVLDPASSNTSLPLKQTNLSAQALFEHTKVFVTSDSPRVLDIARNQSFGHALLTVPGEIVHVDKNEALSDEAKCRGLGKLLMEQAVLMNCDVLTVSKSGVSYQAAYVRSSHRQLYLFTDTHTVTPFRLFC